MTLIKHIARMLWADPYDGQLNRVGYIQGLSCITFIFIVFILLVVLSMIALEAILGTSPKTEGDVLGDMHTVPVMVVSGVVFMALFFANVNLAAKRFRNMGLPGWLSIICFLTIDVSLLHLIGKQYSIFFEAFTVLMLLLLPPGIFKRKELKQ